MIGDVHPTYWGFLKLTESGLLGEFSLPNLMLEICTTKCFIPGCDTEARVFLRGRTVDLSERAKLHPNTPLSNCDLCNLKKGYGIRFLGTPRAPVPGSPQPSLSGRITMEAYGDPAFMEFVKDRMEAIRDTINYGGRLPWWIGVIRQFLRIFDLRQWGCPREDERELPAAGTK